MTTTTIPPEVDAYLARVRDALRDLPAQERDELLADVEASVVEAAAEGGAIAARLGQPEDFAAELRAAAGLDAPAAPKPRRPRLAPLVARVAQDPRVATLHRLGRDLAPIWWVARGYLAVGFVAYALDASWSTTNPAVPRLGNGYYGLLAIVVAVAVSVWIGLHARRHGTSAPRVAAAVNIALALTAIPVAAEVTNTSARDALISMAYAPPQQTTYEPALDGVPIDNIYPYTRDGQLLHDVLLYDGSGQPIDIGVTRNDPNRRLLRTPNGEPIFNSFPIRYFEPGTDVVADPNAGPVIEAPSIVTPPLEE